MPVPSLDDLLCSRPRSLTITHALACLPTLEIDPQWEAKHDAGELPDGFLGMAGCMETVWPAETLSIQEARWILSLREHLSWRSLADFVVGDGIQITGMHLEEAAQRTLELLSLARDSTEALSAASTTYLITRHPGAQRWAEEEGIHVDQLLDHLDVDIVRPGDMVIGSLPVNLAAAVCERGARYFHLSLELPREWRGRELHPEDMRRFGARLEAFHVERTP